MSERYGTEIRTGVNTSHKTEWASNPPYAVKWDVKTVRTSTRIVGLNNKSEADAEMDVADAYDNVEGLNSKMLDNGTWVVEFVIIDKTYKFLGNYPGGVLQE